MADVYIKFEENVQAGSNITIYMYSINMKEPVIPYKYPQSHIWDIIIKFNILMIFQIVFKSIQSRTKIALLSVTSNNFDILL